MKLGSIIVQQAVTDVLFSTTVLGALLGAIVGGIVGGILTFLVQRRIEHRKTRRRTNVLRRSLLTELNSMNYLDRQLERTSEVAEPSKVVKLRPDVRDRSLFSRTIFEANAGSLGLLSAKERSLVIDTYTSAEQVDAYLSTPDPSSDLEDSGDGLWRRAADVAEMLEDLQEKRDRTVAVLKKELPTDDQEATSCADD